MPIYCANCEAECSENAATCPSCGHQLQCKPDTATELHSPSVTTSCGFLIAAGSLIIGIDLLLLVVKAVDPYESVNLMEALLAAAWLLVGLLLCILAALILVCSHLFQLRRAVQPKPPR